MLVLLKRLEVIYEDDSCIIVNKPAGLPVQGGKGIRVSLDSILAGIWAERPLLVHRLDRDTSGIVLVAKTKTAAAWFSKLFSEADSGRNNKGNNSVSRQYLAICRGKPDKPEGTIRLDLNIRGTVKKSATHYRLLSNCNGEHGDFSMLELELRTGRMHQIRRHLALTGNPVLGDDKYGDFTLNRYLRKTMQLRYLLLHASRLLIPQMPDGSRLDISAPLPDPFDNFIVQLKGLLHNSCEAALIAGDKES